jgi:hypothetical protein
MKRSATRCLWRIVVGLFVLALVSRLGVALALRLYRTQLRVEVHKIALSLAKGRGFSDPYLIPTGPTAHQAPLYPMLLDGVYILLGSGQGGRSVSTSWHGAGRSLCDVALSLRQLLSGGRTHNAQF